MTEAAGAAAGVPAATTDTTMGGLASRVIMVPDALGGGGGGDMYDPGIALVAQRAAPGQLYVGEEAVLADYGLLRKLHIDAVASLHYNPLCTLYLAALPPISADDLTTAQGRLCVHEIDDAPNAPFAAALDALVPFTLGHLYAGRNVLVHCEAGRSRSVATAAAVLCLLERHSSMHGALQRIAKARVGGVFPQRAFIQAAEQWCALNRRRPVGGDDGE